MADNDNNKLVCDSKQTFIKNVQQWVAIDSQLKSINDKTKHFRIRKNELLKEINDYVKNNEIQNTRIEISDGDLRFYEKKEYSSLTYSYLETCLDEIIPDKKQIEYIIRYLKEHREIKVSYDIRRNYRDSNEKL
jgi:hypothetical protein